MNEGHSGLMNLAAGGTGLSPVEDTEPTIQPFDLH